MHDCPECGTACYCDMEDVYHEDYPDCEHECKEDFDDDDS